MFANIGDDLPYFHAGSPQNEIDRRQVRCKFLPFRQLFPN
jgi:hypothetical protein